MRSVEEIRGFDALEITQAPPRRARTRWRAAWPKLAAAGIVVLAWQAIVWSGWRPQYVLPGPGPVLRRLAHDLVHGGLLSSVGITMNRALAGYGLSIVVGTALGVAVARVRVLRAAIGSLITGLQTMPSIAWFPLAILLFQL